MTILQEIENNYRKNPLCGVQFSIDADAYKCRVGDRVVFGDNVTEMQCGSTYNYQDVILDGKVVGYLIECDCGRLFDPMTTSFCIGLAYCTETELWNEMLEKYKDNPHLDDCDEVLRLRFATLNQMLDYLNVE